MGSGGGVRVVSLSAFGQQPTLVRTVGDLIYAGPVVSDGRPAVTPLDGKFSTNGGDRALLSGAQFPLPDIRTALTGDSNSGVPPLTFPLSLPLPVDSALPTYALRVNFGSRCLTGSADVAGRVPQSVAGCMSSSPVTLKPRPSWYSGVSFLKSNADDPSAALSLLNISGNASAGVVSAAETVIGFPFLTVAGSAAANDGLVFVTPPGVGANFSVSLSILDGTSRELWRSNAVRISHVVRCMGFKRYHCGLF